MHLKVALQKVPSAVVRNDEPMSEHTTFGVGGSADIFVEVADESALCLVMRLIAEANTEWIVIGEGANLLVSDKGIRGVVIRLAGSFNHVDVERNVITAGASASMWAVADVAGAHSLTGLAGIGGVPGSVGGAIVMNAGTHRGFIGDVTRSVTVVNEKGSLQSLLREECKFTYRGSRFQNEPGLIIVSAIFALQKGDGRDMTAELNSMRHHRSKTQPYGRSAGCFFKNLADHSAGQLIDAAGGKGLSEGDAYVSDTHANFIINKGGASAKDILVLARRVQELVRNKHGINLEYEVRIVGDW